MHERDKQDEAAPTAPDPTAPPERAAEPTNPGYAVSALAEPQEDIGAPQGAPVETAPQGAPVETAPQGAPVETAPQGAPVETAPQGAPVETAPQGAVDDAPQAASDADETTEVLPPPPRADAAPFDGYLHDRHRRPGRVSALGHAVSLAIHGPPVALFVLSLLMHEVVISAHDPHETRGLGGYRVPLSLWSEGHGGLGAPGSEGVAGPPAPPPPEAPTRQGRRKPRVIFAPQEVAPAPQVTLDVEEAAAAEGNPTDATEDEGADEDQEGDAVAEGVAGGDGLGTGAPGASGAGGPGGLVPAAVGQSTHGAGRARAGAAGPGRGGPGGGTGEGSAKGGGERGGAPVDLPPVNVSEQVGKYLRVSESFPKLRPGYFGSYRVVIEVCTTISGEVKKVSVKQSANAEIDADLVNAAMTWQYNPYFRPGERSPRPFCHPLIVVFERERPR